MNNRLPPLAVVLGIAGLIPFALCGLGALALQPAAAARCLLGLVAYGGVILAFLGGVHWGFALDASGAPPPAVQRARLGLGVAPSVVGWGALLAALADLPKTGLLVLVAGFVILTIIEARGTRLGWVPVGYMGLRWVLSVIVVVVLVSVCLVLAFGGRIIL